MIWAVLPKICGRDLRRLDAGEAGLAKLTRAVAEAEAAYAAAAAALTGQRANGRAAAGSGDGARNLRR